MRRKEIVPTTFMAFRWSTYVELGLYGNVTIAIQYCTKGNILPVNMFIHLIILYNEKNLQLTI